ncbi:MAG: hypothetical protein HQL32_06220, partial [Planctomycetes bacterium]|nr:hypothetical protein [Planctomycetota bacterium]
MTEFRISDMMPGKDPDDGSEGEKSLPKPRYTPRRKESTDQKSSPRRPSSPPPNRRSTDRRPKENAQPIPSNPASVPMPQPLFALNDDTEEMTLRDYWETILRYRMTVFIVIIACFAATTVIGFMSPKKYSSKVEMVSRGGGTSLGLLSALEKDSDDSLSIYAIMKLALSSEVRQKALNVINDHFSIYLDPARDTQPSDKEKEQIKLMIKDRAAGESKIGGAVSVRLDAESEDMILLTATTKDSPFISAAIANAYSAALIEELRERNRTVSYRQVRALEQMIIENQNEIEDIDDRIKELHQSKDSSGFILSRRDEQVLAALENSNEMLQEALLRVKELNQKVIAAKELFGISDKDLSKVKFVDISSGLQQKLQDLRFQREELLTRYKPENPSIKKLDNQIRSMEETL